MLTGLKVVEGSLLRLLSPPVLLVLIPVFDKKGPIVEKPNSTQRKVEKKDWEIK